jgi:branched-chain amino acid transport system ATP-binding protein
MGMLAIGRALMTNHRLLLLDEPFEGLAPVIVQELEATMRELHRSHGFAIALVEQHAEDALRLSDRNHSRSRAYRACGSLRRVARRL